MRSIVAVIAFVFLPLHAAAAAQELDATARLMRELTEASGPSGFEGPVREIVVREYEALGADIEYDGLGSVLATLPGSQEGPRIMVTAHMDEVGLMVQHVTPDGFLTVKKLGGWLDQGLPDQRWTILGRDGPVPAVSGMRTVHVTPSTERSRVWSLDETFLDVGAASRAEVEALGVRPGDGVAPWSPFLVLPNERYAAKAWDDRVAEAEGIPLQPDVLTGYGEDGAVIQRYASGRPSANMTVPTRYLHAHTGVIQRSDFDGAVELLIQVLRRLDRDAVEEIAAY